MIPNQTQSKEKELEKKLTEIGAGRMEQEAKNLAKDLGLPYSDLKSAPIDIDALVLIDEATARRAQMAVIIKNGANLTITAVNPKNKETSKKLRELEQKGFKIGLLIVTYASLEKVLARYQTAKAPEIFEIGAMEVKVETLKEYEKQI